MEHTKYCTTISGTPLVLFRSGWSVFSNFNIGKITINGVRYNCVEQWYQSEKAKFFKDEESYDAIMNAFRPSAQKYLGKKIKNFNKDQWLGNGVAIDVMKTGLQAKFEQLAHVRAAVLGTEKAIIAEASEWDTYWGIGLTIFNAGVCDINCWRGENNLGRLWMEVRNAAE